MRLTSPPVQLASLVLAVLTLACTDEPAAETNSGDGDMTGDGDTTGDGDGDGDPLLPGECPTPIEPIVLADARLQVVPGGELHDILGRAVVPVRPDDTPESIRAFDLRNTLS
jgi:hypothetical protein